MLKIDNLSLFYDRHLALANISMEINEGETVSMLGANGAGKSSLLKAIAGVEPVSAETSLVFENQNLNDIPTDRRVELGLSLVPEGRGLFPDLSVDENLLLGANPKRARLHEKRNKEFVLSLFPKLAARSKQLVGTMSGGEQQMVAVGRAIMSEPCLLMLDEPSLGLAPIVVHELFSALQKVRDAGVSILIVEQNVRESLAISDRGYLLETGHVVQQGTAAEMRNSPLIQKAYLGSA